MRVVQQRLPQGPRLTSLTQALHAAGARDRGPKLLPAYTPSHAVLLSAAHPSGFTHVHTACLRRVVRTPARQFPRMPRRAQPRSENPRACMLLHVTPPAAAYPASRLRVDQQRLPGARFFSYSFAMPPCHAPCVSPLSIFARTQLLLLDPELAWIQSLRACCTSVLCRAFAHRAAT